MQNAGALASMGRELTLVEAHHALALLGQSFVAVHGPHDEQVARASQVALRFKATRARRYGTLMTGELVSAGVTTQQVAESPPCGPDAQTPSGIEGARIEGAV